MQSEFHVRSQRKYQMIDITPQVGEIVRAAGLPEAICSVYVTHATAAPEVFRDWAEVGLRKRARERSLGVHACLLCDGVGL